MGKSGFHCMLQIQPTHKEGKCPSEDDVFDSILEVINDAKGYTLFTTFASNYWRLHTVLRAAKAAGSGCSTNRYRDTYLDMLHLEFFSADEFET